MSNTKTQSTIRAKKRMTYTKCISKGCTHNQALNIVHKLYGSVKGLNPATCEANRQMSKYRPHYKDVAQFAPRQTAAHGFQRAGYKLPANAGIETLGNLDACIPVSQVQNDSPYQHETSRRAMTHMRNDKRTAHLAHVAEIETSKENYALLTMAQALMIAEVKSDGARAGFTVPTKEEVMAHSRLNRTSKLTLADLAEKQRLS